MDIASHDWVQSVIEGSIAIVSFIREIFLSTKYVFMSLEHEIIERRFLRLTLDNLKDHCLDDISKATKDELYFLQEDLRKLWAFTELMQ